MRCGVVVLPGSNGDHDVYHVLKHVLGQDVTFLWHEDSSLKGCELVVLPGGFAHGDALRPGALAAQSPVVAAIRRHAEAGGLVLGVGNGFQILLEAGLLNGAVRPNRSLRFECREAYLRVERGDLPFTRGYRQGQVLTLPIAHAEGAYFASDDLLEELEAGGRVVFRYVSPGGGEDEGWNLSGSLGAIAGLTDESGNVLGMMPHPERAAEEILGCTDGLALFESAVVAAGHALEVRA